MHAENTLALFMVLEMASIKQMFQSILNHHSGYNFHFKSTLTLTYDSCAGLASF